MLTPSPQLTESAELHEITANATSMTQTLSRQDFQIGLSHVNVAYGMGLINSINLKKTHKEIFPTKHRESY